MHLIVADHQRLDPARWEIALNLLTVLALDPRCFACHRSRPIPYHDTPDDFFTRNRKWNIQAQTHELEPFWHFSLKFCISGSISGMLDINNAHDIAIVKEAIQHALATPYTRANRQRWELDNLHRIAADQGDDELAQRYFDEQRQYAHVAFTYYDLYDKERLQERHALYLTERRTLDPDRAYQTIFNKLIAAGAAIRAGQQTALIGREPAPALTREAGRTP